MKEIKILSGEELASLSNEERVAYLELLKNSLPTWEDILAKYKTIIESGSQSDLNWQENFKKEMDPYIENMNRAWAEYNASK